MYTTLDLTELILFGCDPEFAVLFYDPSQERDEHGRWTSEAAGSSASSYELGKFQDVHERALLSQVFNSIFPGKSFDEAMTKSAEVSGATKGSHVSIRTMGGKSINVRWHTKDGINASRMININEFGTKSIHNNVIGVPKALQKGGLGAKIFADQVSAAVKEGFSYIDCQAAKSEDMNGYITWPKLGYDAPLKTAFDSISPEKAKEAKQKFPNAKNISDIMHAPGGKQWWQENGDSFDAVFDLSPGSLSRHTLDSYMAVKRGEPAPPPYVDKRSVITKLWHGVKRAVGMSDKDEEPEHEEIYLDPEDDAILDKIWDDLGKQLAEQEKVETPEHVTLKIHKSDDAEFVDRGHRVTSGERRNLAKIGPKQIHDAIKLWKKAVPKEKRDSLAALARRRKSAEMGLIKAGADPEFAALFYGTTPGAYAGWDTRRRGGGKEQKKILEDVKSLVESGTVRKEDLHGLTVKELLGIKKSLGIKHVGTKQSLVEKIHGNIGKRNYGAAGDVRQGRGNLGLETGVARRLVGKEKVSAANAQGEGIYHDIHLQAKAGDEKAKEEVVNKYQGLIHSVIKGYPGGEREDLVQEGNRGILRALQDYDPGRKTSFATHATNWIRNYVGKAARKSYGQTKGTGSDEKIEQVDTKAEPPSRGAESAESSDKVGDMLKTLDKRSADILKMRYGIGGGDPKTLDETAKSLGVTRQRVQQIEKAALNKLRETSAEFSHAVDEMIERAEIYAYMLFSETP